jgi:hypothetical protein
VVDTIFDQLSEIVLRGLSTGEPVEIDGLGVFYPDPVSGVRFEPRRAARVFLAYAREDVSHAARLYEELERSGFSPWMDLRKLLPGRNWPRGLESAIESSDFFIACFSSNSVNKRGGFQAEIRYALDCARRMPIDQIFVVPARLDECRVPRSIQREYQYVDLFPDWHRGFRRVIHTMRAEVERRARMAA